MGKGESWGCEVGPRNQSHLSIMAPKRGKGGDSGLGTAAHVLFPTDVTFSPKDSLLPAPRPHMPSGRGRRSSLLFQAQALIFRVSLSTLPSA